MRSAIVSVSLAASVLAQSAKDLTLKYSNPGPLDYAMDWSSGPNVDGSRAGGPTGNWCDRTFLNQSPIDVVDEAIVHKYPGTPLGVTTAIVKDAEMILTGNGVELELEAEWLSFNFNGNQYNASQLHFHSPSEHTFNGFHCAGEVHIVASNVNPPATGYAGLNAVIALCLQVASTQGDFLEAMKKVVTDVGGAENIVPGWKSEKIPSLNLDSFQTQFDGDYYQYVGSYTTPACNPAIDWFIMNDPVPVDGTTIEFMQTRFKEPANHRPLQPLTGRDITFNHVCGCPRRRALLFSGFTDFNADVKTAGCPPC